MEDKDAKNVLLDILDIQNARVSFDISLEELYQNTENPSNFFQTTGETFSNFLISSQINNEFKSILQIPYVVFLNI